MVSRPVTTARLFFAFGCALLASNSLAQLSLSPRPDAYELDGVKLSQLTFESGTSAKASYQPPGNWKYSGGQDTLELEPPGLSQAKVRISKLSASTVISLDPEGCKRLREEAVASLPDGSRQVKVESEELNPLRIEGKQTYLVELSYVFFGERYACYLLTLERKPEPISFRLTCREKDYAELRQLFHKSLFTWQNL